MTGQDNGATSIRQALESASAHYMNLVEFGILKVFIDFKIFDNIPVDGAISIADLAAKTGGQEQLIRRFADYLVASEVLAAPSADTLAHTARSTSYRSTELAANFITHVYQFFLRPMAAWSAYFEAHGLAEPGDARAIPLGLGTGHATLDLYGVLDAEPKMAQLFNRAQERSAGIYSMKGVYDFGWMEEMLVARPARPAIVDVGGGHGLALQEIMAEHAFVPPSQCTVLDLPKTIEVATARAASSDVLAAVRFLPGTMLDAFPAEVQGALVYLFRRVLSDFVDKDIVLALGRARAAGAPDSRIILVEELVKPGRGKFAIAQDIAVLNFGGKRRSEGMWRELAALAGLQISAVYEDGKSEYAVLELTLA
ncbi:O-methyltransferase, putative [Cordyceps militaris]|uniref:O-methyltransferase, putative n=1 Tax=Cordyceps militaris TaxID=73501 RepID=A0A2H4SEN1_CORMI|nr:O-methyltransferase, putative [Cordyceps militaris]